MKPEPRRRPVASAGSPVFSYYARSNKAANVVERTNNRKPLAKLIKYFVFGLLVVVCAVGLYFIFWAMPPAPKVIPDQPTIQIISANGVFGVSRSGKVTSRLDGTSKLPIIRDETGILAEVGKHILAASETEFIINLHAQLLSEKLNVESITLPAKSAREADVRLVGQGYYIKFSFDVDTRQAVGSYLAVRSKLDANKIIPAEYVDVRVEEKVFYK